MADDREKVFIRLPAEVVEVLRELSGRNERSFNAQVVYSLTAFLEGRSITVEESAYIKRVQALA